MRRRQNPPSFAEVQRLRAETLAALPPRLRRRLHSVDPRAQQAALLAASERFAAALRRKGWLSEEGCAS